MRNICKIRKIMTMTTNKNNMIVSTKMMHYFEKLYDSTS